MIKPTTGTEHASLTSLQGVPGVDVFRASFFSHRFGPHTHDTWGIGACSRGGQDMAARPGSHQIVTEGELSAIPPGEVHAGRAVGDRGCSYGMIYLPDALLKQHAEHLGMRHAEFGMKAVADAVLARHLLSFIEFAMKTGASDLSVQSRWCTLLDRLLLRYAMTDLREARLPVKHPGLSRAMAYIDEHWNLALSLDGVASEAGMSPSYFCRQFTRAFGLPPHRYQVVVRIARARQLLADGEPIALVATATGFADQSHLGRQLKSCLGVTPNSLRGGLKRAITF